MNTRLSEHYRRIGAGLGWLGEETVDVPVKARRERTDEEIQAALKAVGASRCTLGTWGSRALVAKTSPYGSMKSAARADGLVFLV